MIPDIDEAERHAKLILVAEDHATDREAISSRISSLGHSFIIVNDGREAFKEWQDRRFGLVLTNCQMPLMDGFELTNLIRIEEQRRSDSSRTPIVAITANALVGEEDHYYAAGMDGVLCKPIEIAKLKLVIDEFMGSLHRDQDLRTENSSQAAAVNESAQHVFEITEERQIIDFDRLGELVGTDDKELHKSLLTIYWRTALEDFALIEDAVKRKNSRDLMDRIHSAKGATDFAGALRLGELLARLKEEADNAEWEMLSNSIQKYEKEIRNIERLLIKRNIISLEK